MKVIFPIIYSLLLFISLSLVAFYLIGQIRITQKAEKKLLFLEQQIYKNLHNHEDLYKLGQIYLGKKSFNKSITLFRDSLRNWNYNDKIGLASLYNTLGFTYFKLNQYNYAIYYYKQAINLIPDYILALTNLAFCYEQQKNYKEASKIYDIILLFHSEDKELNKKINLINSKLNLRN